MISPLVNDSYISLQMSQVSDAVLCKNRKSERIYHIRYTVIYFRVDMVRTSGKNDSSFIIIL